MHQELLMCRSTNMLRQAMQLFRCSQHPERPASVAAAPPRHRVPSRLFACLPARTAAACSSAGALLGRGVGLGFARQRAAPGTRCGTAWTSARSRTRASAWCRTAARRARRSGGPSSSTAARARPLTLIIWSGDGRVTVDLLPRSRPAHDLERGGVSARPPPPRCARSVQVPGSRRGALRRAAPAGCSAWRRRRRAACSTRRPASRRRRRARAAPARRCEPARRRRHRSRAITELQTSC